MSYSGRYYSRGSGRYGGRGRGRAGQGRERGRGRGRVNYERRRNNNIFEEPPVFDEFRVGTRWNDDGSKMKNNNERQSSTYNSNRNHRDSSYQRSSPYKSSRNGQWRDSDEKNMSERLWRDNVQRDRTPPRERSDRIFTPPSQFKSNSPSPRRHRTPPSRDRRSNDENNGYFDDPWETRSRYEKIEKKYAESPTRRYDNSSSHRPTENFPEGRYVERVMQKTNQVRKISLEYLHDRRRLKPKRKIVQPQPKREKFSFGLYGYDPTMPFGIDKDAKIPVKKRPLVMAAEKVRDYEHMIVLLDRKKERVTEKVRHLDAVDEEVTKQLDDREEKLKRVMGLLNESLSLIPEGVFM